MITTTNRAYRDMESIVAAESPDADLTEVPDGALVIVLRRDDDPRAIDAAVADGIAEVRAGRTVLFRYLDPEPTRETQ